MFSASPGFSPNTNTASRCARRWIAYAMLTAAACALWSPHTHAQQTLARGVTLTDMHAFKDSTTGVTTLRADVTNRSGAEIPTLSVRFVLRDEAGQDVGETTAVREQLAQGETWQASAQTSVPFVTFTAMNVDATP